MLVQMIDKMKKDLKMDRWVHMPPTSYKYQLYAIMRAGFEAKGYRDFAIFVGIRFQRNRGKYEHFNQIHRKSLNYI